MALEQIARVTGRAVHVPGDDIDTDRIIPARYLRCVTFDGLGQHLFHDERFEADGSEKDHPLNDPRHEGAAIMVVGRNFGCGSSREHAPQSIKTAGFRALIGVSFSEIFLANCGGLGMPCASLPAQDVDQIAALIEDHTETEVCVDLETKQVALAGREFGFEVEEGARTALMAGQWDPIGQLLVGMDEVRRTASELPYASWGAGRS